ncbi:putative cytochrome P450 [Tripterygium wilfordii]|uniref:Putative cytochrome P450 n=2 Tax=Tripterygium wilfordii TaxID=458696 RepID=A0A7J7D6H8_TRIWF|nr:putative cytochrome P450 [Tripterygium wilfordii]
MEEPVGLFYGWFKILVISFVGLLLVLKLIELVWWRPRKIEEHFSKQGIRGPSYHLFVGNVKELVGMMTNASSQPMSFSHNILPRVLPFYPHWKKIYGATFLIWFGPNVRLAVSDPDLIREVFTSKSEFFEKIEAHPLVKQLEGDGLLSLKGEKWAHHKKILAPTFHMENLKLLVPVVAKSVINLLDNSLPMSSSAEVEIEVSEWFQTLTEDVITRTTFGNSHEDGKAIFKLQAQQMELAADAFQKVLIPYFSRFFPTKRNINSWRLDKEIKKSLIKLIDCRKQRQRQRQKTQIDKEGPIPIPIPKDLLGLMIQASNITVHDIVEECKGFFFAGKQTTSNLLTWTTVLLAMHPHWQVLARDEVLSVCGSRDLPPSKDDLVKLKTLSMILNESLRLYPPIIAMIRRAKSDVELGTHKVPRGTELLMPILALHHDQSIWGNDAKEFNPGRFSKGVTGAVKHQAGFIPFGLGGRTCIGQSLAILQAKLALAILLQRSSFRLAPTYQHAPAVQMLLHPQYGAPLIFRRLPHPNPPHDSS